MPGAEVLGGEVRPGQLLDVRVDVARTDVDPAPVAVGEKRRAAAAAALQLGRRLVDERVDDSLQSPLAGLGDVVEDEPVVSAGDVTCRFSSVARP